MLFSFAVAVLSDPAVFIPPAIVVVSDPETVAVSPTITELTSIGLGIVVASFPIDSIVVVTIILIPFAVVEFLVVSFPTGDLSFDWFKLSFGATVLVFTSSPPKIHKM